MLHSNGNHTGSKQGHAKVAGILLVVDHGHLWVVVAKFSLLNFQDLLIHVKSLRVVSLLGERVGKVSHCYRIEVLIQVSSTHMPQQQPSEVRQRTSACMSGKHGAHLGGACSPPQCKAHVRTCMHVCRYMKNARAPMCTYPALPRQAHPWSKVLLLSRHIQQLGFSPSSQ